MDTKLDDIFVSYSRADSARVEPWIKRLRGGGIIVWYDGQKHIAPPKSSLTCSAAIEHCQALIWTVSRASVLSPRTDEVVALACERGKAVILITLDTTPIPLAFDRRGVTVIDLVEQGQQSSWEALLKAVRSSGVPWIDPARKARRSSYPNVHRSTLIMRAWLRASIVSVILLILGVCFWPRPRRASPAPVAVITNPVEPDTKSPPPPATPVPEEEPDYPQARRAIEFVTASINAANREDGLTAEQINTVVSHFADPTFMEGKGLQSTEGLKAHIFLLQQKWPEWQERIHFSKVESPPGSTSVKVLMQTSFTATNKATNDLTTGVARTHYEVDFTDDAHPKITSLATEEVKQQ